MEWFIGSRGVRKRGRERERWNGREGDREVG